MEGGLVLSGGSMEKLWRYQLPEPGMLKITGRDQVAFLQRQTTNDIRNLKAGTTLANVLTSPEGRIVDVFRMLSAPDSLMAITLPARSQTTFQFLKNRIFFMDQVSLGDLSSQFILNEISEIAAPRVQHALGFERLPDKGQAINAAWQDQTVTLLWNGPPLGYGIFAPYICGNEKGNRFCAPGSRRGFDFSASS